MKKKSVAITICAMALTATLAIGGTLAYMQSVTETKTNTFSSGKDIVTHIDENFDPNVAKDYVPGQTITKAPVMYNDGTTEDIWVAVSLDYTNGTNSITAADFAKYATINGMNTKDWTKISTAEGGQELYMFKTTLAKKADASANATASSAIFESVTTSAGLKIVKTTGTTGTKAYTYVNGVLTETNDQTSIVDKTEVYDENGKLLGVVGENGFTVKDSLPTFEIAVKGYAVQATGVDSDAAAAALKTLASQNCKDASGNAVTFA